MIGPESPLVNESSDAETAPEGPTPRQTGSQAPLTRRTESGASPRAAIVTANRDATERLRRGDEGACLQSRQTDADVSPMRKISRTSSTETASRSRART